MTTNNEATKEAKSWGLDVCKEIHRRIEKGDKRYDIANNWSMTYEVVDACCVEYDQHLQLVKINS